MPLHLAANILEQRHFTNARFTHGLGWALTTLEQDDVISIMLSLDYTLGLHTVHVRVSKTTLLAQPPSSREDYLLRLIQDALDYDVKSTLLQLHEVRRALNAR